MFDPAISSGVMGFEIECIEQDTILVKMSPEKEVKCKL
jgi:hypothetical protein